ncbi:sensor histidine kinase [Plantibacter sp. YIM 135249]|uniref:sensor histidine kinase n=1 Tax=Plantibacter sp. YIM 135249 TaxID=3423918 RepID=UPI003D34AD8D
MVSSPASSFRERARLRLRAVGAVQAPFLAAVLVVAAVSTAVLDLTPLQDFFILIGVVVTIGTSALAAFVPWERFDHGWVAIIPVLDFIAVAFLRDAAGLILPGVGGLVFFPVIWLAYEFALTTVWLSITGALFVASFPYILMLTLPPTPLDWARVFLLPTSAAGVALSVRLAARHLERQRDQLQRTTRELRNALATEEEERLSLAAVEDTVDAAITVLDVDGRVLRRNRLALEFADAARLTIGLDGSGAKVFQSDGSTPVAADPASIADTLGNEAPDGRLLWIGEGADRLAIMVRSQVLTRADGEPFGTVVVAHDITRLIESIRVRESFLTTVSHELRTPLTALVGNLDLIVDRLEDAGIQAPSEVAAIERNVARLLGLGSDLLLAAGDAAATRIVQGEVGALVRAATDAAASRAAAAQIRLLVDDVPTVAAMIDSAQIRQVVDHLLANAIKFTEVDGTVQVSLRADEATWSLVVADDGIGIGSREQEHIFERFYRSGEAERRAIQGAGLGLAITSSIVGAHGGAIRVDSVPGRGSTFTVTIPRVPAA